MTVAIRKDTPAWLDARRGYVTSSAIPVILGLSPYRSEQDLADEMSGTAVEQPDAKRERMFRLGHSFEAVIRAEDEIEHGIKLRSVNRFIVHPTIPWAATSLDFERVGEKCIVEAKSSNAREWDDGLPQHVEAQARWQMGVAGYPRCHVVVLRNGRELACFDVEHVAATFDHLVVIAGDFYARWQAGGPFAQNAESIKRRWPADNGAEMVADESLAEHVRQLRAAREMKRQAEAIEEAQESAIKTRMADFAVLTGPGFRVTWRRTKDRATTDWRQIADGLLQELPAEQRDALLASHTRVELGFRPLRVTFDREAE
jgi:putative phage-type endonuclease